jgi:drug/metabolite transporter (DMT)-like permease
MNSRNDLKGYAWILLATVTGSTVYVFSKAALNEISLFRFGTWWFAFALLWNSLYAIRSSESRQFRPIPWKTLKVLLLLGLVETAATATFYTAIKVAPNPSIPSFLRNTEYVFVTLLGVIILHERFRGFEIAGVILTFTGAFAISYHRGGTLHSYLTGASGLMLLCTAIYATRTILAKTFIHKISPTMMAINRAIFMFSTAAILVAILGEPLLIPPRIIGIIAIGSFLGPFLTSIGQYSALKYIEASRAAIIQSSTALFTVLGVFLYFGKLPLPYQIVGGLATIGGVTLLMVGKNRMSSESRNSKTQKTNSK